MPDLFQVTTGQSKMTQPVKIERDYSNGLEVRPVWISFSILELNLFLILEQHHVVEREQEPHLPCPRGKNKLAFFTLESSINFGHSSLPFVLISVSGPKYTRQLLSNEFNFRKFRDHKRVLSPLTWLSLSHFFLTL